MSVFVPIKAYSSACSLLQLTGRLQASEVLLLDLNRLLLVPIDLKPGQKIDAEMTAKVAKLVEVWLLHLLRFLAFLAALFLARRFETDLANHELRCSIFSPSLFVPKYPRRFLISRSPLRRLVYRA